MINLSRKLKCQICGIKDDREKIKIKQGYCHRDKCYDQYLKQEEFKQKEKEQKYELYETIKRLHNIAIIPHQFFPYIEALRNGDIAFGKIKKQYKQGFTYNVIDKTYKHCNSNIDWAKDNKDFRGSTMNMLKYTFTIVQDKINYINSKIEKQQMQKAHVDKIGDAMKPDDHDVEYRKTKNKHDISKFLD